MRAVLSRVRSESGQALISGLILLAGVLIPLLFLVPLFARVEQGRLAAEQAARDAVRAAAEAAVARARAQTGQPLELTLEGEFARASVLRARVRTDVDLASIPLFGADRHGRGERRRGSTRRSLPQPPRGTLSMNRAGQVMRDERGAVLVAGLLLTLAVLIVIGAAVDIGRAFIERRELVSLADGAALSGSQTLDLEALHAGQLALDPSEAQATALAVLAAEPELRAQANASPASVSVEVEREIPTVLLRLVGLPTLTVKAQATAEPRAP